MPYWVSWLTPHVFLILAGDMDLEDWGGRADVAVIPSPPHGWTSWLVTLSHCEAGRGTPGRWMITAWYPPAYPVADPIPLSPQPWFPIRACVNDRAAATPVPTSEITVALPLASLVVRAGGYAWSMGSQPGGVIQQWGLFPASDLQAVVLLAASGSPSGMGVRPLSWLESAALWDVPILVSDSMRGDSDTLIFQAFCASTPAKVLFAGTDALLTTSFRGDCY
jgi:hypothetical protein